MNLTEAIERVRQADAALLQAESGPFPVPIRGLEAVVVGAVTALSSGDWWVPGLRERAGAVLRNAPLERLLEGPRGARPYKVAPSSASPALRALYAVGIALAHPEQTVVAHLGIGSAADGAWYEALNQATLNHTNTVFVVAVHPLTGDAPLAPQLATSPSRIAAAFGIPTTEVDGNSATAVHGAVAAAKTAGGPHLIEAKLTPGEDLLERCRTEEIATS